MLLSPLRGQAGKDYRLVQRFGERPAVYKQFGMAGHNGVDVSPYVPGTKGVLVRAPHDGYATLSIERMPSGKYYGYGQYVTVVGLPHDRDGSQHRSDLC